jgi:hypothetical protein
MDVMVMYLCRTQHVLRSIGAMSRDKRPLRRPDTVRELYVGRAELQQRSSTAFVM